MPSLVIVELSLLSFDAEFTLEIRRLGRES